MKPLYLPPKCYSRILLTSWLSLLIVLIYGSASANNLNGTVISDDENISLKVALSEISERHQISVSYSVKQIDDLSVNSAIARKKYQNPEEALQAVLSTAGLEFKKIADGPF